jgi:hypothetical protein
MMTMRGPSQEAAAQPLRAFPRLWTPLARPTLRLVTIQFTTTTTITIMITITTTVFIVAIITITLLWHMAYSQQSAKTPQHGCRHA